MRVFVTGATGLVGSHVVEQLLGGDGSRADGGADGGHDVRHEVRALVRPASNRELLPSSPRLEFFEGGLGDPPERLRDGLAGCDALVHAAALVGARTDRERYVEANVRGTANVFAAAAAAGVRRAVHVSTVAVYGGLDGIIDEERWQERPIRESAFYAWSKRLAEEEAWRHDGAGGMRVSAVRPALIHGERDRHVAPRLDRLLRLPVLPLVDGGRHVPPLVYAGNVATGIIACLEREVAAGRAYNLARDHDVPVADLVRLWARARGERPPRIVGVPGGALEGVARAIDRVTRALPGLAAPGMSRPARLLRVDNPYDSGRARRELGWTDLVPVDEALARTARWLDARADTPTTT